MRIPGLRRALPAFVATTLALSAFVPALPLSTLAPAQPAQAATLYVNGNPGAVGGYSAGNDSNSCTSPTSPCQRISAAISKAADGDIIQVMGGDGSAINPGIYDLATEGAVGAPYRNNQLVVNKAVSLQGVTPGGGTPPRLRPGVPAAPNWPGIVEFRANGAQALVNFIIDGAQSQGTPANDERFASIYIRAGFSGSVTLSNNTIGNVTSTNPALAEAGGRENYGVLAGDNLAGSSEGTQQKQLIITGNTFRDTTVGVLIERPSQAITIGGSDSGARNFFQNLRSAQSGPSGGAGTRAPRGVEIRNSSANSTSTNNVTAPVVISGNTFGPYIQQNAGGTTAGGGYGINIFTCCFTSGTLSNVTIQSNSFSVFDNLIAGASIQPSPGAATIPATTTAIRLANETINESGSPQLGGLTNTQIVSNSLSVAVSLTGIGVHLLGRSSNITIRGTSFGNIGQGIVISIPSAAGNTLVATPITASPFNLFPNIDTIAINVGGFTNLAQPSIDATRNWYGSPKGPRTASGLTQNNPRGDGAYILGNGPFFPTPVTFSPWCGNSGCTVLYGLAQRLEFTSCPVFTPTGQTIQPLGVRVTDNSGALAINFDQPTDSVSLTVAQGPSGALLGGTTTLPPTAPGLVTYTNVTAAPPGVYRLQASASSPDFSGITPAQSCTFNVGQLPTTAFSGGTYDPATGTWYLRTDTLTGTANLTFTFGPVGPNGGQALMGDWDGDGTWTPGLYDQTLGRFYLRNSNSTGQADVIFDFGAAVPITSTNSPIALVGDWDGSGRSNVGLYDPFLSRFVLRRGPNTNGALPTGVIYVDYGQGSQVGALYVPIVPIAGNWEGSTGPTTKVGLYVPSQSRFLLKHAPPTNGSAGNADATITFGDAALGSVYQPLVGDWDGNGKSGVGLFLRTNGTFYLLNDTSPGFRVVPAADLQFQLTGPTAALGTGVKAVAGDFNGPASRQRAGR